MLTPPQLLEEEEEEGDVQPSMAAGAVGEAAGVVVPMPPRPHPEEKDDEQPVLAAASPPLQSITLGDRHTCVQTTCCSVVKRRNNDYPVAASLLNRYNWTCFMNCVLQCLVHTVPLVVKLNEDCHLGACPNDFCCYCALKNHIAEAMSYTGCSLDPILFVKSLKVTCPEFRQGQHQDAHEFLSRLLDKLDQSCVASRVSSQNDSSIARPIFGGKMRSQLCCPVCNHKSDRSEPFRDINLEINQMSSITESLLSFTKTELLEHKSICAVCGSQVNMKKALKVEQAPVVLVIQLKRFQILGSAISKIDDMVNYALELDLNPFMSSVDNKPHMYDLYALVEHFGDTSIGHYVSYIRSSETQWFLFDDDKVKQVSEDTVLHRKAYLLFFVKKGAFPWFSVFLERHIMSGHSQENERSRSLAESSHKHEDDYNCSDDLILHKRKFTAIEDGIDGNCFGRAPSTKYDNKIEECSSPRSTNQEIKRLKTELHQKNIREQELINIIMGYEKQTALCARAASDLERKLTATKQGQGHPQLASEINGCTISLPELMISLQSVAEKCEALLNASSFQYMDVNSFVSAFPVTEYYTLYSGLQILIASKEGILFLSGFVKFVIAKLELGQSWAGAFGMEDLTVGILGDMKVYEISIAPSKLADGPNSKLDLEKIIDTLIVFFIKGSSYANYVVTLQDLIHNPPIDVTSSAEALQKYLGAVKHQYFCFFPTDRSAQLMQATRVINSLGDTERGNFENVVNTAVVLWNSVDWRTICKKEPILMQVFYFTNPTMSAEPYGLPPAECFVYGRNFTEHFLESTFGYINNTNPPSRYTDQDCWSHGMEAVVEHFLKAYRRRQQKRKKAIATVVPPVSTTGAGGASGTVNAAHVHTGGATPPSSTASSTKKNKKAAKVAAFASSVAITAGTSIGGAAPPLSTSGTVAVPTSPAITTGGTSASATPGGAAPPPGIVAAPAVPSTTPTVTTGGPSASAAPGGAAPPPSTVAVPAAPSTTPTPPVTTGGTSASAAPGGAAPPPPSTVAASAVPSTATMVTTGVPSASAAPGAVKAVVHGPNSSFLVQLVSSLEESDHILGHFLGREIATIFTKIYMDFDTQSNMMHSFWSSVCKDHDKCAKKKP